MKEKFLVIGPDNINYQQIVDAVNSNTVLKLSNDAVFTNRIRASRKILEDKLKRGETVYGVTTGYGDSCVVGIPKNLQPALPLQLTRYHQCGLGENFSEKISKAIQLTRIISLSKGFSAIRLELLQFMINVYNLGLVPRIPEEGSVGASGDLTPLAYYAATLQGEGEVFDNGKIQPSRFFYEKHKIKPIILVEKEALALMNGTAVMTALACFNFSKAFFLTKLAARITAGSSMALLANSSHFDATLFEAKPHLGTRIIAELIRKDLLSANKENRLNRLQDRYSIRCAPHIIGVLKDALIKFEDLLNIEINSANDNPLVDIQNEKVLHGGNFYGGHIAFLMDSLKQLIANIADLLDRQMALLVDSKFSNGLPSNLSAALGDKRYLSHGLKALQISASAWTAEALKNTMPASVFSRSTECHNQDKVSMGTIAARDADRVLTLTFQVAAALIISVCQALKIRVNQKELTYDDIGFPLKNFLTFSEKLASFIEDDRPLEKELRAIIDRLELCDEGFIK